MANNSKIDRKILHHEIWIERPHRFPGVNQRLAVREYPTPRVETVTANV